MASTDELLAAISSAKQELESAKSSLEGAQSHGQELMEQSNNMGFGEIAELVRNAAEKLEEAAGTVNNAISTAEEAEVFTQQAQGLQDGGTRARAGPKAAVVVWPKFNPARRNTRLVARIRDFGWRAGPDGTITARGLLVDLNGRDASLRPLRAHAEMPDWSRRDRGEPWRSAAMSIEGQAAAWMHHADTTRAALYLNTPVGATGTDRQGEYIALAKAIPPGSTLTVWSVHPDGSTRRSTFHGQ